MISFFLHFIADVIKNGKNVGFNDKNTYLCRSIRIDYAILT